MQETLLFSFAVTFAFGLDSLDQTWAAICVPLLAFLDKHVTCHAPAVILLLQPEVRDDE